MRVALIQQDKREQKQTASIQPLGHQEQWGQLPVLFLRRQRQGLCRLEQAPRAPLERLAPPHPKRLRRLTPGRTAILLLRHLLRQNPLLKAA
jgi:hypothetical protein